MTSNIVTQAIEPVRKSFFNVLRQNLKTANRINYIHRIIYIGEHTFNENSEVTLVDCIESTINNTNKDYTDEHLTGLMVCYPKYFCHVLEGSEDSLHKHLFLIYKEDKYIHYFGRMKLLVCYHHVNQRFMQSWSAVSGKPPSLLEKIDVNCDLIRTSRYIYNCVYKLYNLAHNQRPKPISIDNSIISSEKLENESTLIAESQQLQPEQSKHKASILLEKFPDCLPEYGLLEFLLTTQYTQDLYDYFTAYGDIPDHEAYRDKTWPVTCDFIPLNVFDKPHDPCTDLPTVAPPQEVIDISELID